MAVVDRRGCDGCGRTLPVEELAAVTLGDEQAVCCPECREHAESVVEETTIALQRGECAGCGGTHPVDDFELVELPDGSTVPCCEECREHAESVSRRTSVDGHRGECSGCDEGFDVSDMEVVELDDGTTVACCGTCAEYARAAAETTADEPDYGTDGGTDAADGPDARGSTGATTTRSEPESSHADGDDDPSTSEETALADQSAVCDQCGDWVDVELFEVVTVDDRVEELCPPCKDRARKNSVVTDVRMRCEEAYDVLDVDPGSEESVIRDAYLSRIKTVHPDSDAGDEESFRRVQRAYERLTN